MLFAKERVPDLRAASGDLAWLLSRGYSGDSALALVGNRYRLVARQRVAVRRATCSDAALRERTQKRCLSIRGQELWVDGHNVLTSVEAALGGGVILRCRDGSLRDMASMHGTWRRVEETASAIDRVLACLEEQQPAAVRILLDRPVSNSGRLRQMIADAIEARGTLVGGRYCVELVEDPDRELVGLDNVTASADSAVIDGATRSFALAAHVIESRCPDAWIVDFGAASQRG